MHFGHALITALALHTSRAVSAASWSFDDATLTVQGKGAGVGGGLKEKLTPSSPLSSNVELRAADALKISLTTTEGKTPKRAHQAFLTLHESVTGLEESFVFAVKENGKGRVEITQKDLPIQLLTATAPLEASLIIASFGDSTPYRAPAFQLTITPDDATPLTTPPAPERYAAKPQIIHQFKSDPKSPPKIISLVFTLAVLATVPVLLGAWAYLGGNLDDAGKAMQEKPIAHGLFLGSVVAMEGVFAMYYLSWNLFQTLPVVGVVGAVAFVSGSRALREVKARRERGER